MSRDQHYSPFAPAPRPRQPAPAEEVWRPCEPGTDRVQSCQLRNDSNVGAGWDVLLFEGDDLLFSRQCATEADARFSAHVMKDSTLHAGWVEAARKAIKG